MKALEVLEHAKQVEAAEAELLAAQASLDRAASLLLKAGKDEAAAEVRGQVFTLRLMRSNYNL